MMRGAALLLALLFAAASSPRADADAPPTAAAPPTAPLTEEEAIHIADDVATQLKVDLTDFDPPSATYVSDGRIGKWHIFYTARSHHFASCFSVDVYRRGERPHFSWCS